MKNFIKKNLVYFLTFIASYLMLSNLKVKSTCPRYDLNEDSETYLEHLGFMDCYKSFNYGIQYSIAITIILYILLVYIIPVLKK